MKIDIPDELLNQLVDMVAERVIHKLGLVARPDEFVDQHSSPLGTRTHCKIVRALVAAGNPGAAIRGRRHMLSRSEVASHLAGLQRKPKLPATSGDRLEIELDELKGRGPTAFDRAMAEVESLKNEGKLRGK